MIVVLKLTDPDDGFRSHTSITTCPSTRPSPSDKMSRSLNGPARFAAIEGKTITLTQPIRTDVRVA